MPKASAVAAAAGAGGGDPPDMNRTMAKVASISREAGLAAWVRAAQEDAQRLPAAPKRYRYSAPRRATQRWVCTPLSCLPCLLYSGCFRLLCALPTCGESIGGACCGVYVTRTSDDCLRVCWRGADEEAPTHTVGGDLSWVAGDAAALARVRPVLECALDRMDAAAPVARYAVVDWLGKQMAALGHAPPPTLVPANARRAVQAMCGDGP